MGWTKDQIANNLLRYGVRWNSQMGQAVTVSYSFPTQRIDGYSGEGSNFSAFTSAQKTAAVRALGLWSEVSNLSFVENTSNYGKDGAIRFANTVHSYAGWAYYPSSGVGGDVWMSSTYSPNFTPYTGSYGANVMIHEIGHAIGLMHPSDYTGGGLLSDKRYAEDNQKYTVMSYLDHPSDRYAYATGPQLHDIYAIQKAYGVNWNTRSSDTSYSWDDSSYFVKSIWDGGGSDTIDAANQSSSVRINLNAGSFSSIGKKHYESTNAVDNVSIAYGAVIENAKGGAGKDTLIGNSWNNIIEGGAGDDSIYAAFGHDVLKGDAGKDWYYFGENWGQDTIDDAGGNVIFTKYSASQLGFLKSGNDLIVSVVGGSSSIKISDYYTNASYYKLYDRDILSGGRYTYKLITPTQDDIGNTQLTSYSLSVGQSKSSTVYQYDRDWFKVALTAGKTYEFEMNGASSGNGTLSNPYINLFSSDGTFIKADDNSGTGTNAKILYTAAQSGTYYIDAKAQSVQSGTYTFSVSNVEDDVSSIRSEASALNVGTSKTAKIDYTYDHDWYKVTLTAGTMYQIDMKGRYTDNGTLSDPYLMFYDADGNRISYNDNGGTSYDARISYHAVESGTYYIRSSNKGSTTGTYALSTSVTSDTALAAGDSINATLAAKYEKDWYKVTVEGGKTYQFDMKGRYSGNGTASNPFLILYDDQGKMITYNDNGGTSYDARISFHAAESGVYYLRGHNTSGATGSYVMSATTTDDTELTSNSSKTASLATKYEKDWYEVTLEAGKTYQFDMKGRYSQNGTVSNPYLMLYDGQGSLITYNDNGGTSYDARITYRAFTSGTYYLRGHNTSGATGTYVMAAKTVSSDATLDANTIKTATISSAYEQDWYKMTLSAGKTYQFDMKGRYSSNGTLSNPYLMLYDGNGTRLSYNDNGGTSYDARITYHALESGTYYLRGNNKSSSTGSYKISSQVTGVDTVLEMDSTVSASIATASELDFYKVTLEAGELYQFDMEGAYTGNGTLSNPYLMLYDDAGSMLSYDDNGGTSYDARILYQASDSGTYYLRANNKTTTTGTYKVSASKLSFADDHGGDQETATTLAIGDVETGTMDMNDHDWFKVSLTANTSYRFDMTQNTDAIFEKQLTNPLLSLIGTDGSTVLASNDNGGNGAEAMLTYTAPTTGTYYLDAQQSGIATGAYKIFAVNAFA